MKHVNLSLFVIIAISVLLTMCALFDRSTPKEKTNKEKVEVEVEVVSDTTKLTSLDLTKENFYYACELLGVSHPEVVYAQALLESGHFGSSLYRKHSNMLGLYNSNKRDYFHFKHWTDCLVAYRDMVQYKYTDGDYYEFLRNLPYAEDKDYIHKVKWLVSNEVTPRKRT